MAELPDNNGHDDDGWRRRYRYVYAGREVSFDEMRADVEAQTAGLDPDQWIGGEFDFDDWLADSVSVGTVKRVYDEDQG